MIGRSITPTLAVTVVFGFGPVHAWAETPPVETMVETAPPLGAEVSLMQQISRCWLIDPGSEAAKVTVVVGFGLDQQGRVEGQVTLVSSDGDQSATNMAFASARRAIFRCQSDGYPLFAGNDGLLTDVVVTFDPSGLR